MARAAWASPRTNASRASASMVRAWRAISTSSGSGAIGRVAISRSADWAAETSSCSVTSSGLEDELRLEQELRPVRVGWHEWGPVAQVVPVEERPELGVDLVGCPGDVAGQAVPPHGRRHSVDTRDHGHSRSGYVVDA